VFRNIRPWYKNVKEEELTCLPTCCKGHNLEYTDLKLDGDGSPASKKMLCIHFRENLLKEDKLT
jgi:hypothetical protein